MVQFKNSTDISYTCEPTLLPTQPQKAMKLTSSPNKRVTGLKVSGKVVTAPYLWVKDGYNPMWVKVGYDPHSVCMKYDSLGAKP